MLHETAEVLLDLIELTKPVTIRHAEQPQKPERDSGFVRRYSETSPARDATHLQRAFQ